MHKTLSPYNAISPQKKDLTHTYMRNEYNLADNIMRKTHQDRLDTLKKYADNMDKIREDTWKHRALSANKNNTILKYKEMKNLQNAA